jgi:mannose-6-phosphate isomerase
MEQLYPIKFEHQYKETIWGGTRFQDILNRHDVNSNSCGESWEISAIEDNVSIVANGFLQGNSLQEIVEIYMDELVGFKVYEKFGDEFPLLIKFLDSNDVLSVQVHPNDEVSKERHNAYGKTEMWYVVDAEKDAELIIGFKNDITQEKFLAAVESETISEVLHLHVVKPDEVYYLPAGSVHAIGKGLLVAEIQQTSDITYRIFDWNRTDDEGNARELHVELALDVIDYKSHKSYKTDYVTKKNDTTELVNSPYFTTNLLFFDKPLQKDYYQLDSFVIYMCLQGYATIDFGTDITIPIQQGETVLVPASLHSILLTPTKQTKILEVYIS